MRRILFQNILLDVPDDVYFPSDDSFLLAGCSGDLEGRILELGCGSGIISLSNARRNSSNDVLGIDINPSAVYASERNAQANDIKNACFIESDLFSAIGDREFDFVIFNPPYLPTSREERLQGRINTAFDGGRNGHGIIDRFLLSVDSCLSPRGSVLLLCSSLNNRDDIVGAMEGFGMQVSLLAEESFFFEKLMVLKGTKP